MPLQLCVMNLMAGETLLLLIIITPQLEGTIEIVHRLVALKLCSRDAGDLPSPSGEKGKYIYKEKNKGEFGQLS